MQNTTGSFKATSLWKSFVQNLENKFKIAKKNRLSGCEISQISFDFFNVNGCIKPTKESVVKICQLLLDWEIIAFKKRIKECIFDQTKYYIFFGTDNGIGRILMVNKAPTEQRQDVLIDNADECQVNCIERNLALSRLLKLLDLSIIQSLVDLVNLTTECEHINDNIEMCRCDLLNDYKNRNIHLTEIDSICVSINCLELIFKDKLNIINGTSTGLIRSEQINILKNKYLAFVKYLEENRSLLNWDSLLEIFKSISQWITGKKKKTDIINCLQFSFILLPFQSLHISYHLFSIVAAQLTNTNTPNEFDETIEDALRELFAKIFPKVANRTSCSSDIVHFIIENFNEIFSMRPEIVQHLQFVKINFENRETSCCRKISSDAYKLVVSDLTKVEIYKLVFTMMKKFSENGGLDKHHDQIENIRRLYPDAYEEYRKQMY